MPDSASQTKSWFPWRVRFSLAGMLVIMTGLAIYFAVRNLHHPQSASSVQWSNPWKAVATFLFVIGIFQQVRDLERTRLAGGEGVNSRIRWEQGWRISAGVGLVVLMVEIILQQARFEWFIGKDTQFSFKQFPLLSWFLLLFTTLQFPYQAAERYATWRGRCLGMLGLVVGCGLLLVTIYDRALIPALIYFAIRGVEITQSYRRGDVWFYEYQYFEPERRQLQSGAILAAAGWLLVMLAGWLSLHVRSRGWRFGLRWFAIIGLLVLIPVAYWGRTVMISVQPFYLPHPDVARPYFWLNGLVLFCLLTALTTAVLLRDSTARAASDGTGINWRGPFGVYWHEQWNTLIVWGIATLEPVIAFVKETWELPSGGEVAFTMWASTFFYDLDLVFGAFTLTWIIAGLWQCFRSADRRSFAPLPLELPWRSALRTAAFVAVLLAVGMQIGYWLAWVLIVEPRWL